MSYVETRDGAASLAPEASAPLFAQGSVRDELLRLARTLNGLEAAREGLHVTICEVRDRIEPVLELQKPSEVPGANPRPDESYAPVCDTSREIRRISTIIEEITDAYSNEIRELAWIRERVAL
jgi:hypothetical protein